MTSTIFPINQHVCIYIYKYIILYTYNCLPTNMTVSSEYVHLTAKHGRQKRQPLWASPTIHSRLLGSPLSDLNSATLISCVPNVDPCSCKVIMGYIMLYIYHISKKHPRARVFAILPWILVHHFIKLVVAQ